MLSALRRSSPIGDFCLPLSAIADIWVAEQAAQIPAGSKVLDVGAGSAPYRPLFAHCTCATHDFAQLKNAQLRHGDYARIDVGFRCEGCACAGWQLRRRDLAPRCWSTFPKPIAVVRAKSVGSSPPEDV